MRHLFVTQYFYPEEFRGNEIAFDWAKRGDKVTVITAIPNYPIGKFYKGYGLFKKNTEFLNGVEIIRIPVIPRGSNNNLMLVLNYISFVFSGTIYALFLSLTRKFDSIFVQQLSPVTVALPAIIVKKIQNIPLYLWVLDLWPESVMSITNICNTKVLNFTNTLVRFIYKSSDIILISSKGFEGSICTKGDFKNKIMHFPNWAESEFSLSNRLDIPNIPKGFIVMFAGNLGEAQDFEKVMQAILLLKSYKNIKFVILGDGRKKKWIDEFCIQNNLLDTVLCFGRFPIASMPSFFNKADIMLVSLMNKQIFNLTLPAKIQAYMVAGKPIIGMMNGEGSTIIKQAKCGFCVAAGDYIGLANQIKEASLLNSVELSILGLNGKNFANENFDRNTLLDNLYSIISKKNNSPASYSQKNCQK